jgi:hypothetical protein
MIKNEPRTLIDLKMMDPSRIFYYCNYIYIIPTDSSINGDTVAIMDPDSETI